MSISQSLSACVLPVALLPNNNTFASGVTVSTRSLIKDNISFCGNISQIYTKYDDKKCKREALQNLLIIHDIFLSFCIVTLRLHFHFNIKILIISLFTVEIKSKTYL